MWMVHDQKKSLTPFGDLKILRAYIITSETPCTSIPSIAALVTNLDVVGPLTPFNEDSWHNEEKGSNRRIGIIT
jgi:hypothetical protein